MYIILVHDRATSPLHCNQKLAAAAAAAAAIMASSVDQSPFFQSQKSKGEVVVRGQRCLQPKTRYVTADINQIHPSLT